METRADSAAAVLTEEVQGKAEAEKLASDYAEGVKGEMFSLLEGAVGEGSFTQEEAEMWYRAIDACEKLEHLESLLDFLYEFIDSGGSMIASLENLLQERLFTDRERMYYVSIFSSLSYKEKERFVGALTQKLKKLQKIEQEIASVLNAYKRYFSLREFSFLSKEFYTLPAERKEKFAVKLADTIKKRQAEYQMQQEKEEERRRIIFVLKELNSRNREQEALNLLRSRRELFEPSFFFQLEQEILVKIARREVTAAYH